MSEETPVSSLSPEIRAALRQARAACELTPDRNAVLAERFQQVMLDPHAGRGIDVPMKSGGGGVVASATGGGFSGWILAGVGLLGLGVGLAVGWMGGAWSAEETRFSQSSNSGGTKLEAPPIEEVALPVVSPPGGEKVAQAEGPPVAKTNDPEEAHFVKQLRPPEPTEPQLTFYEELSYLRRAQSALKEGNAALSLGLMLSLDELNRDGALLSERRMTKVLALCELGRAEEARGIGAQILQGDSKGVYRRRIESSCVGKESFVDE